MANGFRLFVFVSSSVFKKIKLRFQKSRGRQPLIRARYHIRLLKQVQGRSFPRWRQFLYIGKILSRIELWLLRSAIVFGIIALVWLGWGVVRAYQVEAPAVGGAYIEAVVGSPRLVNPLFASLNNVDMDLSRLIYSGLMRYTREQKLTSDLAVGYEISEDKKTYTFSLKKDVTWHDGKSFTARDVVYTMDLIQEPATGSPLLLSFQGVKVEVLDDYTVRFTLSEPFPSFLASLTVGILPEHVWSSTPPEQIRLAKANLQPVGTGPFVWKSGTKNDLGFITRFELARFANYYRNSPYLEELTFDFFSEYEGVGGAINALRDQKVNGLNFIPTVLRERVERKHINLYTLQLPQYTALFFNKDKNSGLDSKEIRIALGRALDKNRIIREALRNEGAIINGPLLPGFPGYEEGLAEGIMPVEEANAILDKIWKRITPEEYKIFLTKQLQGEHQAGAIVASSTEVNVASSTPETVVVATTTEVTDAEIEEIVKSEMNEAQLFYRQNKEGKIFEISLVTADTAEYKQAARLVAGFWQELGVKTEVKLINAKDISREALKNRDYDVLLYGVIIGGDPDQYSFWHSSQINYPGLNLSRYANKVVDDTLTKIRQTDNTDEVNKLYVELRKLILDDVPAIFLYTPTYTYAQSDKIKGFDVKRISHPSDRFVNVTDWYIKTKKQWK